MKRYSEYKDSGVKWIGEIPGHWKICRTRYLCNINTGDKDTVMKEDNGKYPFYVRSPKIERINTFSYDGEAILMAGDGVGAGKVFHYANGKFDYHQRVYNMHNICGVSGKFMFYFIRDQFHYAMEEKNAKSTVDSVRLPWLKAFPIAIPAQEEQEAIVTYLDTKAAKIDEYISIAEKKIAALEELKQTIITEAVTRGIHKDVPMKDSGVKWIGMIPEHWKIVAIKRFSEIILGKMLDKTNGNEQQYLCAKDVHFDEINLTDLKKMYFSPEEQSKYRVRKGDLLVVEGGACGTCAILRTDVNDIFIQNSIMIVRGDKTKCVNDFIAYSIQALVQKGYTESVCNKATIMHFTKEKLGNTLISLPPLPEQQEIVTYLDSKVANINQLCQAERSQIEKLKEYKQRLISDVVTGKVKVTNDSLNGRV